MSHLDHHVSHAEPRQRINWWVLAGRVIGFGGLIGFWIWMGVR